MPTLGADRRTLLVGTVSLAAAVWTVTSGVVPVADAMQTVLVPAVFVVAGVLAPVWRTARFTTTALLAVGSLHLVAFAASATARFGPAAAEWHLASQVLFVAGFGVFLALATGYPDGPASRPAIAVVGVVCLVPVAAAFSSPTPAVLAEDGVQLLFGPILPVLPPWVGTVAGAVFVLPVAAAGVALARAVRGGRETRGRIVLPLAGLGVFAALLALGSVLSRSAGGVADALFLVSAPLVPVGLVLGARPVLRPVDVLPAAPEVHADALAILSPREREVLAAMAGGETNAAIARRLHMSTSAVEKHTTAIFAKLGLPPDATTHRRVAAVVAYLRAAR